MNRDTKPVPENEFQKYIKETTPYDQEKFYPRIARLVQLLRPPYAGEGGARLKYFSCTSAKISLLRGLKETFIH